MKTLAKITLIASAFAFTAAPSFAVDGHDGSEKMAKEKMMKMKAKCKEKAMKEHAGADEKAIMEAVKKCMAYKKASKKETPSS